MTLKRCKRSTWNKCATRIKRGKWVVMGDKNTLKNIEWKYWARLWVHTKGAKVMKVKSCVQ